MSNEIKGNIGDTQFVNSSGKTLAEISGATGEVKIQDDWSSLSGDWKCLLVGGESGFYFHPRKGTEPNWFWRWMQYLAFGFKWGRCKGER